ncbi:MAG: hypothetical protein ACKPAD_10425 [Bacteroidota bacterium]
MSTIFYGALLLWLAYRIGCRFDFGLPKWVLPAFLLTKFVIGAVVFFLFTVHYPVRSDADIFKYFDDAVVLSNYMEVEHSSIVPIMVQSEVPPEVGPRLKSWYSGGGFNLFDSSRVMVKLHILMLLFSFGSYHVHSFVFAFLSFLGCIALLKSLRRNSNINMWVLLGCMMMPSFQLWSSAPLKESVSFWLLMVSVARFYDYLHTDSRKQLLYSFLVLIPLYFIKPFYVLLLIPCVVCAVLVKDASLRKYLTMAFVGVMVIWVSDLFLGSLSPIDMMARKQGDFLGYFRVQTAESMSAIPELQPDLLGLFKVLPHALLNAFLKPLPWDSLNPLYLASSLENIFLLALIVLTAIQFRKNRPLPESRFILFVLSYFCVVLLLLGFSCPVIGSLMRFKSPVLVFVPIAFLMATRLFVQTKPAKDFVDSQTQS